MIKNVYTIKKTTNKLSIITYVLQIGILAIWQAYRNDRNGKIIITKPPVRKFHVRFPFVRFLRFPEYIWYIWLERWWYYFWYYLWYNWHWWFKKWGKFWYFWGELMPDLISKKNIRWVKLICLILRVAILLWFYLKAKWSGNPFLIMENLSNLFANVKSVIETLKKLFEINIFASIQSIIETLVQIINKFLNLVIHCILNILKNIELLLKKIIVQILKIILQILLYALKTENFYIQKAALVFLYFLEFVHKSIKDFKSHLENLSLKIKHFFNPPKNLTLIPYIPRIRRDKVTLIKMLWNFWNKSVHAKNYRQLLKYRKEVGKNPISKVRFPWEENLTEWYEELREYKQLDAIESYIDFVKNIYDLHDRGTKLRYDIIDFHLKDFHSSHPQIIKYNHDEEINYDDYYNYKCYDYTDSFYYYGYYECYEYYDHNYECPGDIT